MNATKFTFDTVFSDDASGEASRARRKRSFSEAEVAQLCDQARAEGAKAAEVLALEAIAAGAGQVADAVRQALERLVRERQARLEESAQVAFAIARKLAQAALAQFPSAEVEAALREAMHQAIGEPRIVLKAAPKVAASLAGRVAEIAHEEAYEGKVQVSPDASFQHGDCRIEWRGGGAERAEAVLEAALQDLISRTFHDCADEGTDHGE